MQPFPVAALLAGLIVSAAWAQPECASRGDIAAGLAQRYGERQAAWTVTPEGWLAEMFINAQTGSWSVVVTLPNKCSYIHRYGVIRRMTPGLDQEEDDG